MTGIPKTTHQIFFGGEEAAPPDYRAYRQTWRANHPNWSHEFWDAARCRNLVEEAYPWFLETYDGYEHRIQRCDAIRYFILHSHGGLYVDMDIENLKPVDELIGGSDLLLSENIAGCTNAIMGSAPEHELWPLVFDEMQARRERPRFLFSKIGRQGLPFYICRSTGPLLLDDCVRAGDFRQSPSTKVCPAYIFEPFAPRVQDGRTIRSRDTSRSYAIHHMSLHWLPPRQRLTSRLFKPVAAAYWGLKRLIG